MARSLDVAVQMAVEGMDKLSGAVDGLNEIGTKAADSQTALDGLIAKGAEVAQKVAGNFQTLEQAQGQYMVATGKSREEAQAFSDQMSELMGNTHLAGVSLAELTATGTKVEQQFGTTGEATDALVVAMHEYAKVTGGSAVDAADKLSGTLDAYNLPASEAVRVMDLLVKSNQTFGTEAGPQTIAALGKMAPAMDTLGLSIDDAITLLNFFESANVNASQGIKALWQASLKLQDNIPPITLDEYIQQLAAIEDPAKRSAEATKEFGKVGGPALASAIEPGMTGLSDFAVAGDTAAGSLSTAAEALTTTGDKFTAAGDSIKGSLDGLIEVMGPISTLAAQLTSQQGLGGLIDTIGSVGAAANVVSPLVKGLGDHMGAMGIVAGKGGKALAVALVPGLKWAALAAGGAALAVGGLNIAGDKMVEVSNKATDAADGFTAATKEEARQADISARATDLLADAVGFIAPWSDAADATRRTADAWDQSADRSAEATGEIRKQNPVLSELGRAWDTLTGDIRTAADQSLAAVKGMAGNIKTSLSGMVTDARNAGRDMIDGLAGSIRGGVDKVVGAAKDVAGRVKDILKLGSPAKTGPWSQSGGPIAWMERNGRMMIDGLNRGLSGAVHAPGIGSGSGRVNARGGVVVNIYAGVGDPVAIGREVHRVLGSYYRASGSEA